jgi:hypothetical protein
MMKFEDWMRSHLTQERLQEVERELKQLDFLNRTLAENVFRIHAESFKALALSESVATASLKQLLFLLFGEKGEDALLPVIFIKHLRTRQSNLYTYFRVVEKARQRLEAWNGEQFDVKKDSLKIMGAAIFWHVTLISCIEVARKVLADDKWERGTPLTWDEATAEYVAYWFSTRDELDNQWWPPGKSSAM